MLNAIEDFSSLDVERVDTYQRQQCALFCKTAEPWGEFSNMAPDFPLVVNGTRIRTTEALYQACRFPHLPEVQREIIAQASPMAAKMKGKPHRANSRADFDALRVQIMWWALRVKLSCNLASFSRILRASGDRQIVEQSRKDAFWGAKVDKKDPGILIGQNVLGRLLAKLRNELLSHGGEPFGAVSPPNIPGFLLYGMEIGNVGGRQ